MKFLVDECLSPRLALIARDRGFPESSHVVWEGRGGFQDWNLVPFIVENDWTFVTKNSYDFRGPAQAPGTGGHYQYLAIHAGLVCLNGDNMDRRMQEDLFNAVLDAIADDPDLVNQGLEATLLETDEIAVERYPLP